MRTLATRAEALVNDWGPYLPPGGDTELLRELLDLVIEARQDEREACAKIVDVLKAELPRSVYLEFAGVLLALAAERIRSRA